MWRRAALGLILGAMWGGAVWSGPGWAHAQEAPETYSIYTEAPRLFLRPARLRLLRRERDRKSLRWEQFSTLTGAGAPMPEPGFANALAYQITGDASFSRSEERRVGKE